MVGMSVGRMLRLLRRARFKTAKASALLPQPASPLNGTLKRLATTDSSAMYSQAVKEAFRMCRHKVEGATWMRIATSSSWPQATRRVPPWRPAHRQSPPVLSRHPPGRLRHPVRPPSLLFLVTHRPPRPPRHPSLHPLCHRHPYHRHSSRERSSPSTFPTCTAYSLGYKASTPPLGEEEWF